MARAAHAACAGPQPIVTTRPRIFFASSIALLALTGLLLHVDRTSLDIPLAGRFEVFPVALDGWEAGPGSADVLPSDLQTPETLVRAFRKGTTTLWVSVGYYSKRAPPPELSLPSRGWGILAQRVVRIPLDERTGSSLRANLLIVQAGDRRTTVLSWYQIGARPFASAHWYRMVLLWNRLAYGRAESALVRIVSPLDSSADPTADLTTLGGFVRAFYGELVKFLPR